MMAFDSLLLIAALAGGTAPQPVSLAAPTEWTIKNAPDALRPAISRADVVIADVHAALLRELQSKLEKGGPILALRVCHMTPGLLARRVRERDGLAAGFTSDRLRNPANAPPAWAAGLIARHAGRRMSAVDGYAVNLGNRVGVLRPIAEHAICANCHGPLDQVDPAVRRELRRRYPADRATDFAPGEIRGWYWVELPKALGASDGVPPPDSPVSQPGERRHAAQERLVR
jgi:hypothetical protein